jgi:hypothetical protein
MKQEISLSDYELWLKNKNINPKSGRRIKENSKIYKLYDNIDIKKLYILETIDDKDPISLVDFWIIENDKKKIVYEDYENLIFYKDTNNKIRCFEKSSIEYMMGYKIKLHPITNDILPEEIFQNINPKKIINDEDKSIEDITMEVFQLFSNNSFFIDYVLFLDLSKEQLLTLYYEIGDFYKHNFNDEQKRNISNNIFKLSKEQLEAKNIIDIQKYILHNMKILLEVNIDEYKIMINYILIGGLSIVIPLVKELYPDFIFTF